MLKSSGSGSSDAEWRIDRPNLPDITVERAKECVQFDGRQLEPGQVNLDSTLEVNEDGNIVGVTLKGIPEAAPDFGACIRNALRDMPIAQVPFREAVERLNFHRKHASDSPYALMNFIKVIPGEPMVKSDLVLEVDGMTIMLPVTINVRLDLEKLIDLDQTTMTKIGQMAIDTLGYDEIMRRAEQQGWVKRVPLEQTQSAGDKRFIGDGVSPTSVQEIVKESFRFVMTKTAPVAVTVSQLDSPAPGYADLVAVGIFAVSLVAVGGVSVYIYVTNKDVPTTSVGAPAPQPEQPQPPAPPPPPPPPLPRETCEANSEMKKIIRCDDPKISHYDDWNENTAFNKVVKQLGQGLSKGKSKDDATDGPCKERGGFHTNVLRAGKSVASIMGCYFFSKLAIACAARLDRARVAARAHVGVFAVGRTLGFYALTLADARGSWSDRLHVRAGRRIGKEMVLSEKQPRLPPQGAMKNDGRSIKTPTIAIPLAHAVRLHSPRTTCRLARSSQDAAWTNIGFRGG